MRELLDTLVLAGVLQGVGLSVVLARRAEDALANRLLSALTAAVSLLLLLGYCQQRWAFSGYPHLLALGAPLPFLFGALLYLYIVALTRPVSRFDPRWVVHALPFVVDVIFMTQQFYVLSGPEKLALARAQAEGRMPLSADVMDVFVRVLAVAYLAASWIELQRYDRRVRAYFSDLARIDLRWLRALILAHAGTWGIVIAAFVFRELGMPVAGIVDGLGLQVGATFVVFLTGYMSLFQPGLFEKADAAAKVETGVQELPEVVVSSVTEPEPAPTPTPTPTPTEQPQRTKYQRNRIEDSDAEALVQRLLELMDRDQPYRDGSLTLPTLAEALGVTPHMLSQLLNVRLGRTFYAFVNAYRVAVVKEALADPSLNARGVLELAFEAGFNSKSTLNAFFKRETGLTPTEYRSQIQARTDQVEAA